MRCLKISRYDWKKGAAVAYGLLATSTPALADNYGAAPVAAPATASANPSDGTYKGTGVRRLVNVGNSCGTDEIDTVNAPTMVIINGQGSFIYNGTITSSGYLSGIVGPYTVTADASGFITMHRLGAEPRFMGKPAGNTLHTEARAQSGHCGVSMDFVREK